MAAEAKSAVATERDLQAERAEAYRQLSDAREAAEVLAGEEEEALATDDSYSSWERRKRLAAREIDRLRKIVSDLEVEIDDDLARQELAAFELRCAAIRERNTKLRKRLVAFRKETVPKILELLIDLCRDEEDVASVNHLLPSDHKIRPADFATRSMPAVNSRVLATEVVELWCLAGSGQRIPHQSDVVVDGETGAAHLRVGGKTYLCVRRKFRRVERSVFARAHDAPPLWQSLRLPNLSIRQIDIYDGKSARSRAHAIALLQEGIRAAGAEYEVNVVTTETFDPVEEDGSAIRAVDATTAPPAVHE